MQKATRVFGLAMATVVLLGPGVVKADTIVVNGGFEDPVVTAQSGIFFDSIPGWSRTDNSPFEIQPSPQIFSSAEGNQHIELDSYSSYSIYQNISTTPGSLYELTFAFAARPGQGINDNVLGVYWDGDFIASLSADGGPSIGGQPDWKYFSYLLTATSSLTEVRFRDLGISNTVGTLLDDVSVSAVPTPSALVSLLGLGMTVFGMSWWRKRHNV